MSNESLIVPNEDRRLIRKTARRFASRPSEKTREDLEIAIADLGTYKVAEVAAPPAPAAEPEAPADPKKAKGAKKAKKADPELDLDSGDGE